MKVTSNDTYAFPARSSIKTGNKRVLIRTFQNLGVFSTTNKWNRLTEMDGLQYMKTLSNSRDKNELLVRFANVRPDSQPRWGAMSAHQMICHLSDSFRGSLGERYVRPATNLFKRKVLKWVALWVPLRWPHGIKTLPEMDQQRGGTPPSDFASDSEKFRILFERFCSSENEFAPHGMFGQMSRSERMRHAYLHIDHHLRQFGA